MTRKPSTTAFWRGRLPHWEVDHGLYFVTMRLAGSIPPHVAAMIREMALEMATLKHDRQLALQRKIFLEMEKWLDACSGPDFLTRPAVAEMLMEAMDHRQREGIWDMYAYVLMPNHLHLFFGVEKDSLRGTLTDFKRWTGRQAAGLLGWKGRRFWHGEWFDHWSRSEDEDRRIVQYIRDNPVKARLVSDSSQWPYASWGSG